MEPKLTPRTTELLSGTAIPLLPGFPPGAIPFTELKQQRDPFKAEKVAIIGTAPSSRLLAPFDDLSWTIWGTSPGNMLQGNNHPGNLKRIDAWVEMHNNMLWPEHRHYGEPYVKWLNEAPFPVMAMDIKMFPRAIPFPWKPLVEEFGTDFLSSTFSWCMAYAITHGAKEIGLWGVDMSSKDEYILQRPGGKFFIREAKLRGIKVTIPDESDLAQPTPLYGISDGTSFGRKMAAREQEVRVRIQDATQRMQSAQAEITYLNGALEDIQYVRNIAGIAINPASA